MKTPITGCETNILAGDYSQMMQLQYLKMRVKIVLLS
jgi:hypothetical protein